MNVFEDLIVELKEENLLENTVIETEASAHSADPIDITDEPNPSVDVVSEDDDAYDAVAIVDVEPDQSSETEAAIPAASKKQKFGREFFNKRAVAEVSSLQMVEHVLTGVEREHLKVVPKTFDDFNAKKALNTFLQMSESSNTDEHKRAEFDLMHETESWCSALGDRDRNIPVSSLRQYCENSRPALSSQALLALGRFYRNSPYSENVRAKFDFVITRLFSRAGEDDRRACLFGREEMLQHVTTLYADWSSVPLYTADSDESNVLLTALSFDDLATEAENTSNFDQLITSDFFGRLRLFKESISELFYAPNVTAAAIECNIRIGNAYVNLIECEHKKSDASSIQAKYGDVNDQTVSDAAGWTLELAEIIRQRADAAQFAEAAEVEEEIDEPRIRPERRPAAALVTPLKKDKARTGFGVRIVEQFKNVNKWVLISSACMLLLSGGLFVWANYYAEESVPTTGVRAFELEASPLSEHLKNAKVSGDTFYGLLQPSWDLLPKEKRVEFIQKALQVAQQQGAKQVQLISKEGKPAGYASPTKTEIIMP